MRGYLDMACPGIIDPEANKRGGFYQVTADIVSDEITMRNDPSGTLLDDHCMVRKSHEKPPFKSSDLLIQLIFLEVCTCSFINQNVA